MAPQAWPHGNPSVTTLGINVAVQSFIKAIFFLFQSPWEAWPSQPMALPPAAMWQCCQLRNTRQANKVTKERLFPQYSLENEIVYFMTWLNVLFLGQVFKQIIARIDFSNARMRIFPHAFATFVKFRNSHDNHYSTHSCCKRQFNRTRSLLNPEVHIKYV